MNIPFIKKQSSVVVGVAFLTLGTAISATAATFNPAPLFNEVSTYNTVIPSSGDSTDVYFPTLSNSNNSNSSLPIALFLQGSDVDKAEYSKFASIVAGYGFVVVVPNHLNDVFVPFGVPEGLFAEEGEVNDVLSYMKGENSNPNSPVFDSLDPSKMVLLGHSYGGIVGLNAIQGTCIFPTCTDNFTRPPELLGGAFYGSALSQGTLDGITPPLNNNGLPVSLLAGNLDGVTPLPLVEETFNQVQEPPKSLITITGTNHFGITNDNNPPGIVFDPNTQTLDKDAGIETIARWSALFLRGNVLGDEGALEYVNQVGDTLDTNVSVISQTQGVPEPTSTLGILSFGAFGLGSWLWRKCIAKNY